MNGLFATALLFAILSGVLFIVSIAMFIGFRIPELYRELRGVLEKKQLEEIKSKKSASLKRNGRVNVFEELEKNAVVKTVGKSDSKKLNMGTYEEETSLLKKSVREGTAVLNVSRAVNPNFVIVKDIKFTSTDEVLR